jgi:hypothetical protein
MPTAAVCLLWTTAWFGLPQPAWAVRYGEILSPDAFSSVGLVEVVGSRYRTVSTGTGTLIAADIVITAAHVLDGAITPQHIKFSLDGGGLAASAVVVRAPSGYRRSLGQRTPTPADDLALLKLDRQFPAQLDYYPPLTQIQLLKGQLGDAVGFGRDASGKLNIRSSGRLKFHAERPNGCLLLVPGDDKNQITDVGDSGGPFLIQHGKSPGIAAIVQGKFLFEPDETQYPGYDAIDLANFVSLARHAAWIRQTTAELERYPRLAAAPRYVPVGRLQQPHRPLTIDQICGLIRFGRTTEDVLQQVFERGTCEPTGERALNALAAAGAGNQLVQRLRAMSRPVMTWRQVLALLRSGTSPDQIKRMIWNSGGLYGGVDGRAERELRRAGADDRLIGRLREAY